MSKLIMSALPELRYQPTQKRIRAISGGHTFVDSRRAQLVWEPKRIVPSYAVPREDLDAVVAPGTSDESTEHPVVMEAGGPPVLDPRTPFGVHTCVGEPVTLTVGDIELSGAGFRLADSALAGHVVL
jgi:hypothetical protein